MMFCSLSRHSSYDEDTKGQRADPSVKKRPPAISLWKTGLQKKSKQDILLEAELILERERSQAEGNDILHSFICHRKY
jgi:hypothetical protein